MAFQSQFLRFHEAIKLDNFDENATLREKRDIILTKLRDRCKYTFTTFNQGSYAMNTGVIPLDHDYDIDVGVLFKADPRQNRPEVIKNIVFEAINGHTQRVEWRDPCITVFYQKAGETLYHVDLPVYLEDAYGQLHLAMGKQHASADAKVWQTGDPRDFIQAMRIKISGDDALQMRRVIRYLKRWKDEHFSAQGNASPRGIGLTVAAYSWFQPVKAWDARGASGYDDLTATWNLVRQMRSRFHAYTGRLELRMSVAPNDDVFRRMTDQQMQAFKQRLDTLDTLLQSAAQTNDARYLVRAFGTDFMP